MMRSCLELLTNTCSGSGAALLEELNDTHQILRQLGEEKMKE